MNFKRRIRSWYKRVRLSRTGTQPTAETVSRDDPREEETAPPAPPENADVARRRQVLSAYARCLDNRCSISEIRDISELPYTKDETLDAIASEILAAENETRVEAMKGAAAFLADFQHGVGPTPLTLMGMSDRDMLDATRNGSGFLDPLKAIQRNPSRDKYKSLKEISDQELAYIMERLTELDRRRRSETKTAAG